MKKFPPNSLCGWCRYEKENVCIKFNKEIQQVEVEYPNGNQIVLLPTALRCIECLEEERK